jgi:hypothetical protein
MEEPTILDKQQTGEMPSVKSPTLNSLVVSKVEALEGQMVVLVDIVTIKMLMIFVLIVGCFNLAAVIFLISAFSVLFGKSNP